MKFKTMQSFHFEVLVRDECIEFFQIYHRTVSPILFSCKKRIAKKLLSRCFCFLNCPFFQQRSLLWHFYCIWYQWYQLLVKVTSFRFFKEVITLCSWTSMLKFPSAIILKWSLKSAIFIMLVSITWFPLQSLTMWFISTVRRAFSKGRLLLANIINRF